ncbi:Cytochrome P450 3A9 [Orchesella cincta]|uniref:Cytochrome P450 3A9 n=1 Tax=Orchesella cincta TaxID=48709 RepID=A0A1D2MMM4_ORCCI|nr:Cytochrome P450 3A9 [Orchesella cincta]
MLMTSLGKDEKFCGMMEMGKGHSYQGSRLGQKDFNQDFDHFLDRRLIFGGVGDHSVLRKMLPFLEGEQWKAVRSAISHTFTTSKIRRYNDHFNSIGKSWTEMLRNKAENSKERGSATVQVISAVNQFAVDVISATVFGMDGGAIKNPNAVFATNAIKLAKFKQAQVILGMYFPRLCKFLGLEPLDGKSLAFFENLVTEGLKARMSGATAKRNDFLQMMVELKKGELKDDEKEELDSFEKEAQISSDAKKKKQFLTDDVINSQSFMFFFAGFSAPKDFCTFTLYVLAVYQDIQEKVREEVNRFMKDDGTLAYDDVGKLVYLDMVFCEVLRKYPPGFRQERVCTKDYNDPETGLFVPKGTLVPFPCILFTMTSNTLITLISLIRSILLQKTKPKDIIIHSCPGGMRLALIECKSFICHIVHRFRIEPTEKTQIPIKTVRAPLQQMPPPDLELKFTVL